MSEFKPDPTYCDFKGYDCPHPLRCLSGCYVEELDYLDPEDFDEDEDG